MSCHTHFSLERVHDIHMVQSTSAWNKKQNPQVKVHIFHLHVPYLCFFPDIVFISHTFLLPLFSSSFSCLLCLGQEGTYMKICDITQWYCHTSYVVPRIRKICTLPSTFSLTILPTNSKGIYNKQRL